MDSLETVLEFVDRIRAHDVVGMGDLMTPDHRFTDSLGAILTGRDAVCKAWRRYFEMVPDYRIEIARTLADGAEVALFGMAHGTYSGEGRLQPSDTWQTPAAWRALVRDGKVAEWHVYADNDALRRRAAGNP